MVEYTPGRRVIFHRPGAAWSMVYPGPGCATIYGLRARESGLYFYVGSTKYTAEKRLAAHLDDARTGRNPNRHFVNKLRLVGPENVVADVLSWTDLGDRFETEYAWIQGMIEEGHPITNIVTSIRDFERQTQYECGREYQDMIEEPGRLLSMAEYAFGPPRKARNPQDQDILDMSLDFVRRVFTVTADEEPDGLARVLCVGCEELAPQVEACLREKGVRCFDSFNVKGAG